MVQGREGGRGENLLQMVIKLRQRCRIYFTDLFVCTFLPLGFRALRDRKYYLNQINPIYFSSCLWKFESVFVLPDYVKLFSESKVILLKVKYSKN